MRSLSTSICAKLVQNLSARDQSNGSGAMSMGMDHMMGMMKDMQAMMGSCKMMQGAHPPAAT